MAKSALGAVANNVTERRTSNDPTTPTPPYQPEPEPKTGNHFDFAPNSGVVVARRVGENGAFAAVGENVRFSASQINSFRSYHAYEHNLVERNHDNSSNIVHPNCAGEADNFFINRNNYRPPRGRAWTTDLNGVPYFDINDDDPCTAEDLTIGVYHPYRLIPGYRYSISMLFPKGEKARSRIQLSAQKLEKNCLDTDPWCVGLNPSATNSEPLISDRRFLPNCFVWRKASATQPC